MFNKFFYSLAAIVAAIVAIAFLSNGCNDDSIPPVGKYPNDAAAITDTRCYSTPIPAGCIPLEVHHSLYDSSYFTISLTNAGTFNGSYAGWCMDLGTTMAATQYDCAHMFSSLEPFPQYLKSSIEGWQDMDKVNYLINHWHVGNQIQRKNYLCQNVDGLGTINAVDFQKAIWRTLDEGPGNTYSELSDSLIVNALVCDMNAHGEGFVPSCANGDLIVFFLDPGLNPNVNGTHCYSTPIPTGCVNMTNVVHGFNGVYPPYSADTGCYWNFNLSNAGSFNGNWCGWCMDLGTTRQQINFNCAHLFSSLAAFPAYLKPYVQGWQDMDKINYLVNHFQVGQSVQMKNINCVDSGGTRNITVVDLQKVIWMILDEGPGIQPEWEALSTLGVRMAIWCDVMAHGEGFVPSCTNGDDIVFIIDPGLNLNGSQCQPIFAYAPCCTQTKAQPVLAYARCCTASGPKSLLGR